MNTYDSLAPITEIIEIGIQGPPGGGNTHVADAPALDNSDLIANTRWVNAAVAAAIAAFFGNQGPYADPTYFAADYVAG